MRGLPVALLCLALTAGCSWVGTPPIDAYQLLPYPAPSVQPLGPVVTPVPAPQADLAATPVYDPAAADITAIGRPQPAGLPVARPTQNDPALLDRMIQTINEMRAAKGLSPVVLTPVLTGMAQEMADDLAAHRELSHVDSSGERLSDRLTRHRYAFRRAIENLAAGIRQPEDVVRLWLESPEHARGLLNPEVCQAGIGYVYVPRAEAAGGFRTYWVLDMARPAVGRC